MVTRRFILALCLVSGALHLAAQNTNAQTQPSTTAPTASAAKSQVDGGEPHWIRPETPEQRMARIGTQEDPGPDPDLTKHFWRFGHSFTIEKDERRFANFDTPPQEGWIRPFGFVNTYRELYQMNDKWVWVWQPDREQNNVPVPTEPVQETPTAGSRFTQEQIDYLQNIRSEFSPFDVPNANVTVRFEEASQGLPMSGSWRNSVAIADMNEDKCPDIVAPPERGVPGGRPAIFLGDCKGHWTFWKEVKWPHGLDYGSVAAGDFNKDGHMDLVFGVHLTGVYMFFGDGKGNFTETSEGLPLDFPTRRVIVTDVDHDGYPDIVALSEGPTPRDQLTKNTTYGKLRVYYNRQKGKKWEGQNISRPDQYFGGDWLSVGKFNDDVYPDFAAASNYFNGPEVLYVSGGAKKYVPGTPAGKATLYYSYYYANTAGHFSSKTLDDAVISFTRFWPDEMDPKLVPVPVTKRLVGLDRITFVNGEAKRIPIIRWPGDRGLWAVASGDLDGDGNLDVIYARSERRKFDILLGDGAGNFSRASIEGLKLEPNTTYDLKVADVNGDGRPDIIMTYESAASTAFAGRDGSIHVFLNRGAVPADQTKTATSNQ